MGKVRNTTIKQFFSSNSDQSWNIKKKKEILAQVSCIIYKVIELLLSEFSLSFLFHHSHFSPITNHVSNCHFPSCRLLHHSYPSNDPFLPVLLLCCRSFQMPLHQAISLGPEPLLWRGTCSCWCLESSQRTPHSPQLCCRRMLSDGVSKEQ